MTRAAGDCHEQLVDESRASLVPPVLELRWCEARVHSGQLPHGEEGFEGRSDHVSGVLPGDCRCLGKPEADA